MGIRFFCPNGHKLNVKSFQAGMRGICPQCGTGVDIPMQSTRSSSHQGKKKKKRGQGDGDPHGDSHPMAIVPQGGAAPASHSAPIAAPAGPTVVPAPGPAATQAYAPVVVPQAVSNPLEDFPGFAPESPVVAPHQPVAPVVVPQPAPVVVPSQPVAPVVAVPQPAAPVRPAASAPPRPTGVPADALDEAPDAVWYVRPANGGQYGPAGRDAMRVWLAEGRIGVDSLVWREGWRDWLKAGKVFPQLAGEEAMSDLASAIEQEVYAPRPAPTPAQAARHGSDDSNSKLVPILLGSLAVIVVIVLILWALLGGSGDSEKKPAAWTGDGAVFPLAPASYYSRCSQPAKVARCSVTARPFVDCRARAAGRRHR